MAITVPPPPYKIPMTDSTGRIQTAWIAWLRDVFNRIGGEAALSNVELEALIPIGLDEIEDRLDALESDVTSLETTDSGHTTSINALLSAINDLKQGPVL